MRRCNAIDLSDPVSDHPLNRGLVSWWIPLPHLKGSNTLFDLVKTGRNHGTLTNGPTWTAGPNGFGAVRFDGTDDYVNCGSSSGFNLGLSGFTVEATVRVNTATLNGASRVGWIFGRDDLTLGRSLLFGFGRDGATPVNNALNIVALTSNGNYRALRVAATTLNDGGWHHVAACYRPASDDFNLFVDGASIGTGTSETAGTYSGMSSTAPLYVGGRSYTGNLNPWGGDIGSGSIRGRECSPTEVAALYDQFRRSYPDLLRRLPTSRTFVSAGGAPTGNRRRRVLLLGRN